MLRGRYVGIALLFAAPLMAQSADPLDAKVRALAHPRYAEREKAARELEAAGEPALKALREAAKSNDQEVRARSAVVCDKIERTLRSQRLLAAPKLALKFDKASLEQALTEFCNKAQVRCLFDKSKLRNPDRLVTLDTGDVPYWEAVHAFYQAAGLAEHDLPGQVNRTESAGSVRINRRLPMGSPPTGMPSSFVRLTDGPSAEPVALSGALRVRALPTTFAQNKYDDIRGEVTFHLDVDPAPTLALRDVIGVEVRKATAEDGRPLAAAYPVPPEIGLVQLEEQLVMRQVMIAASGELSVHGGPSSDPQPVTLKAGGLRPKKLAELHAVVVARVVTPPEALITVAQLLTAEGKEVTADGLTVQVKNVEVDGKQVTVTARLVTRTDLADDVLNFPIQMKGRVRQFIRFNRGAGVNPGQLPDFKVHNAAGVPLRGLSSRVTSGTYDGTTMIQDVRLTFEKPATLGDEQLSLVLMGKRAAVVEMPFVLKNVPLP